MNHDTENGLELSIQDTVAAYSTVWFARIYRWVGTVPCNSSLVYHDDAGLLYFFSFFSSQQHSHNLTNKPLFEVVIPSGCRTRSQQRNIKSTIYNLIFKFRCTRILRGRTLHAPINKLVCLVDDWSISGL
jgi:hypothetical protein